MDNEEKKALKAYFHEAIRSRVSWEIGASMTDEVEYCLEIALDKLHGEENGGARR